MNRNTILLVYLLACISFSKAESSTNNDSSKKTSAASANAIPTEKPDAFNAQQDQHQQFRYQHLLPSRHYFNTPQNYPGQQQLPEITKKHLYGQHPPPQPVAMVIIAQPAYIPASMIQGSGGYIPGNNPHANSIAQQLLHFFHTNPQARHQLLYGTHQPQPQATYLQPVYQPRYQQPSNPSIAAAYQSNMFQNTLPSAEMPTYHPASQNYVQHVVHPAQQIINQHSAQPQLQRIHHVPPQQYVAPQHMAQHHVAQQHASPQQNSNEQEAPQPQQLNHIAEIAQQAAQRFLTAGFPQAPGVPGGIRTTPAVITGLENFSPEHQAKIKQQLSAHFGALLQPLNAETAAAAAAANQKTAMAPSRSYASNKYYRDQQTEFVPSPQIKSSAESSSAESEVVQSGRYTKM